LSLIKELKRRSVFKVTVAYALVAWLVAQLAEFGTGTFGAPGWVLRTFVVLLLLGFPIAIVLAWAFNLTPSGLHKATTEDTAAVKSKGMNYVVVILLGVVLLAAVVLQFWAPEIQLARPISVVAHPVETQSLSVDIAFPQDTALAFVGAATLGNGRTAFAISPNGKHMVFTGLGGGEYALYLRGLDDHGVRKLNGTENAYNPFFSPNGEWIAFFVGNELKRIALDGGTAVRITEATNSAGGTWVGNDRILAFTDEGRDLLQIDFVGGREESVISTGGTAPHALPDGQHVLLVTDPRQIAVLETKSKEMKLLPIRGHDPRYLGGFLFYSLGSTLYAVRFDLETLSLESTSVPVLTGLRQEIYGFSQWALADNGTLMYAPGIAANENPLMWVNRRQKVDLQLPQRQKGTFEISPDGAQLAVMERQSGSTDIWLYDFEGSLPRKLTFEPNVAGSQMFWMPDGKSLIYHRETEKGRLPFRLLLDSGVPDRPLLAPGQSNITAYSISADGRFIGARKGFVQAEVDGSVSNSDSILLIDLVDNKDIEIPSVGRGNWGTAVSPDGRAVVYTSPVSGEYQNYLQPVPPTGARFQISRVGGAEEPRWSQDGSKIYYRSGLRIMVVDVQLDPDISLSEPRVFYGGRFVNVGGRSYDISLDEKRALVIAEPEDTASSLHLVTNWLDKVERIVSDSETP